MADALSELSQGHGQPDPDAQATLNDFLDYTEFFPSDLSRSLTLIGKLDDEFQQHADNIHSLTKTYGSLPTVADSKGRDAHTIRSQVSTNLDRAIQCRAASYAEATRVVGVTDNLYNRLLNIRKKLVAMPKPPSREPSPVSKASRSPNATRTRKADTERLQKLKQMAQDTPTRNATAAAREKKRSRRIIVPGEVLPPMDPLSPLESDLSDSEEERPQEKAHTQKSERKKTPASPIRLPISLYRGGPTPTLGTPLTAPSSSHALKVSQSVNLKTPRLRPHGVFGTNAHSQVAGISVSNAQASLTPPPENPQPGSEWAPWFALTEWELNILRRKMKKNANWKPSDTMTRKTLMENGRGKENYERAKLIAQEQGTTLLDESPHLFSIQTEGPKVLSTSAQSGPVEGEDEEDDAHGGRNSRLTQARMLKKEGRGVQDADGQSVQSAQSGQSGDFDFMRFITDQGKKHSELYNATHASVLGSNGLIASPVDEKTGGKSTRKRKRETKSTPTAEPEGDTENASQVPKKIKLTGAEQQDADEEEQVMISTSTMQVPLGPEGVDVATSADREETKLTKLPMETAASSRPTRGTRDDSVAPDVKVPSSDVPDLDVAPSAEGWPPSRMELATTGLPTSKGPGIMLRLSHKAASAEPPSQRTTRRRASETSLMQQPAREDKDKASNMTGKRGKRSAPGMTINSSGSGTKLSLTTRQKAPAPTESESKDGTAERYGPDEELFCICERPSFGTMVACENEDHCAIEWFHLECVGLTKPPTKSQKWWCPDCREALNIGPFGENLSRRTRAK